MTAGILGAVKLNSDAKYVELQNGEREYYDLAADPYELQNLAAHLEPGRQARLAQRLKTLSTCAGAGCRAADVLAPP